MTGRVTRSLSTWEGWGQYVDVPPATQPDRLSVQQLAQLSAAARAEYDHARRIWHANILLRTRQVEQVHAQLQDLVDSNLQGPDRVKSAAAIDAPPALGKSTVANTFARAFHREQILQAGPHVDAGDTIRLPVCHVTLTGRMTIKGLHQMILGFYAHPAATGGHARSFAGRDLARAAAECVERHDTQLMVVDDLHFLNLHTRDGVEVANQLKWLANEYNATFVFAGVALRSSGLVGEGHVGAHAAMAQTFRRWTVLELHPFALHPAAAATQWRRLIASVEDTFVLTGARQGDVTALTEYLYERSGGHIGSLMDLLRRAASRAIRTGAERFDRALLDEVRIDEGAEQDRAAVRAALRRRRAAPAER